MTIAFDALAYVLVRDAIAHDGPADPKRVPRTICRTWLIPGADPTRFAEEVARAVPHFPEFPNGARDGEPPLRCYLDPACPKPRLQPRLDASTSPGRSGRITVRGRLEFPPGAVDQCAGNVRVLMSRGGRRLARRTVRVPATCRFSARLAAGAHRWRRTAVDLRYSGSPELLPARVRTRT